MDWQQILGAALLAFIGVALPPLSMMFLSWIKKQPWVKKLHLEDFFSAMTPQVVQWVEYWAEQLAKGGKKPSSEEKAKKFVELLRAEAPDNLKDLDDDAVARRAEAELLKLKNGLK